MKSEIIHKKKYKIKKKIISKIALIGWIQKNNIINIYLFIIFY